MGLFKEIAEPLIAKNIPVIPLRPRTKIAFLSNWPDVATTDLAKIEEWDKEYPDANAASVAKAVEGGIWILEIDRDGVLSEIETQTGKKIPSTLAVSSSPARGHLYFRHSSASLSMGNIKVAKDGKESFSARANNAYCVAPRSYHPVTGKRYELIRDVEIVSAPDWLVQWCKEQSSSNLEKIVDVVGEETFVYEGSRDNTMAAILGKARQNLGMDREQLYEYGKSVNDKRFRPPLADADIRRIANSIGRYEVKEFPPVIMGGVPLGQSQSLVPAAIPVPEPELIKAIPYPVFPRWVMEGTSIYKGLVEPFCKVNSRYPEFMFMPAVSLILNYLYGKVRVEYKNIIPSMYLVSIGRKGRVIKSSSVKDAVDYLHNAGLVEDGGPLTRSAEGKSLIFTAGSSEGLGIEMARTNCKNAVLFYDELSTLTSKASIEGSSIISNLLAMYESGKFSNIVKSRREVYNFEANSYCASLIACTTDENFLQHWSRMAGGSSGLDERFFFLYQPEILIDLIPYTHVDTRAAALETKKLVDRAIAKGTYHFADMTPLEMKINKLGNRAEIRAEKFALYFAIDLGLDEIDEGCVERGLALAEYEIAVKKYLKVFESNTKEASIQNSIIQALQRNQGRMEKRRLEKITHSMRYGTQLYGGAYYGLVKAGYIAEYGSGVKGDPQTVILMRNIDEDEE